MRSDMRALLIIVCATLLLVALAFLLSRAPKPAAYPLFVPPSSSSAETASFAAPSSASSVPAHERVFDSRTKTAGCAAEGPLPDHACTPGAALPDVTAEQICVPGYSRKVRDVPESVKKAVYAEYGIATHQPGAYEVDHLVSLELGGSNDIANLWPETAEPRPGFHEKDRVENDLHAKVCNGSIMLSEAQRIISGDWMSDFRLLPAR
jgi:hypothetical protein